MGNRWNLVALLAVSLIVVIVLMPFSNAAPAPTAPATTLKPKATPTPTYPPKPTPCPTPTYPPKPTPTPMAPLTPTPLNPSLPIYAGAATPTIGPAYAAPIITINDSTLMDSYKSMAILVVSDVNATPAYLNDTGQRMEIGFRITYLGSDPTPCRVDLELYDEHNRLAGHKYLGQFMPGEYELFTWDGMIDDWPLYPGPYRINVVAKMDVIRFERIWGSGGDGPGEFSGLTGIAIGPDGNIYVSECYNHRIQVFDPYGDYLRQWGSYGNGSGQFNVPWGICFDSDGHLYVADVNNNRIQKFDLEGNYLGEFGSAGNGYGHFYWPIAVTMDQFGDIFVTEEGNKRVQKLDTDGNSLGVVTQNMDDLDPRPSFIRPRGIAADPALLGKVYVTDHFYDYMIGFPNSHYIYNGLLRSNLYYGRNFLNGPEGVAIDESGRIFVADAGNDRIVVYSTYRYLSLVTFGSTGSQEAHFNYPGGVALDDERNIYVADANNFRVQKFRTEQISANDSALVSIEWGPTLATPYASLSTPSELDNETLALIPGAKLPVEDTVFLAGDYRPMAAIPESTPLSSLPAFDAATVAGTIPAAGSPESVFVPAMLVRAGGSSNTVPSGTPGSPGTDQLSPSPDAFSGSPGGANTYGPGGIASDGTPAATGTSGLPVIMAAIALAGIYGLRMAGKRK